MSQNARWSAGVMRRAALPPLATFGLMTSRGVSLSARRVLVSARPIKLPDSCFHGNDRAKNIKSLQREEGEERQREEQPVATHCRKIFSL